MLAAASGVGFGIFQSVNVRAVRGGEDPYASTFAQVTIAALALVVVSLASGDLMSAVDAPLWALGDFAMAGVLHFLAGWSLLNLSQQRIGAARTSPLLAMTPIFGVVIALLTVGQVPGVLALFAIALMCAGAYLVAMRGGVEAPRIADALPALGCAFMWALSPIFILHGLEGFESPLVGLTVGMLVSVAAFAPLYGMWRGLGPAWQAVTGSTAGLKMLAGVLVGVSTWWRWAALEDATVGAVLALNLLATPVVLVLAPMISGRHLERVTFAIWAGAALVIFGALILVVA